MPNAAPRVPRGGYLICRASAFACASVSSIGGMSPWAPTSQARAMWWSAFEGGRSTVAMPQSCRCRSSAFTVSKPKPECSMSTKANSQPATSSIRPIPGVANSPM